MTVYSLPGIQKILATGILLTCFFYAGMGDQSVTGSNLSESNQADPRPLIRQGQALLKEGDLVVRLNRDPGSAFVRNFNRHDKSYSHAGIVLFENGLPNIYHLVNGETRPDETMKKELFPRFCDPRKNGAFAIFRFDCTPGELRKLKDLVVFWYKKGVRFDTRFDLRNDDKMYCSEMVSKALARATRGRISIKPTKLSELEATLLSAYSRLPLNYTKGLSIVSIDNLYNHPSCHLIKAFNY